MSGFIRMLCTSDTKKELVKNMKRPTLIILALTISLGLSACGVGDTAVPPVGGVDQIPGTIPAEETGIGDETEQDTVPEETEEEPIEEEPDTDTWNLDYDNAVSGEWGGVAQVEAVPLVEDPDLSRYIVKFYTPDGAAISVTWVGPVGLGVSGALSKDKGTFVFTSEDFKYRFETWGGKLAKGESLLKDMRKEDIFDGWDAVKDSFTVVEDSETTYIVRFMITAKANSISYRGYAYYIDALDKMEEYLFAYLIDEPLFNTEEALAAVNSIEYYENE